MLNYLSAEWYKLRHTKGIFVGLGILLLLITVLFVPTMMPTFAIYTGFYLVVLPLGFFLAPIFAVRAFDDQYGRGTLKNEIVFGIPRSRSYLGKLIFGGIVGTAAAFVVLGFYLFICFLLSGFAEEHAGIYVELCIQGTLMALPLWLASMSLAFCLQAIIGSSSAAMLLNYLLLIICTPISLLGFDEATNSLFLNFLNHWFFVAPYRDIYTAMDQEWTTIPGMGYSWLVGAAWVLVTSIVGLAIFHQKELK